MSRSLRLVAVAAALALVATGGAQAATPQLRLNLNAGHFLEVITQGGTHIRTSSAPGTLIPPGAYQAVVSTEVGDADDTHHMFHLSGPGQNLQTDLLGGDSPTEIFQITLLPSSTYTFADDRNPALTQVVFTTSSSGTADTGSGSSGGSQSGSGGTTSNTPTSNVSNKDTVGSKVLPVRGTLTGGVDTAGRISLRLNGRTVGTLKAGRYKLSLLDETAKAAFILRLLNKQPQTISGKAYVGRRTVTVALKAGQWMFYSSPARKTFFIVHA
jgi:hypothetical protein